MKLSLRVFKQGKPIFWIVGAVFVFVIFYLLFNKSGSSASTGGGVSVVQTGPSDALQAASLQASSAIQAAQISAGIETARVQASRDQAYLASQVALAQLGSGEKVALATLDADKYASGLNAQTNLLINEQDLMYSLESAKVAGETQKALRSLEIGVVTHQLDVNAMMFGQQLDANAKMYAEQSRNLIATTALGQVSGLKKKSRDEALTSITAGILGYENDYVPQGNGGGGGGLLGVISPVSKLFH